jgi:hypothetical protein
MENSSFIFAYLYKQHYHKLVISNRNNLINACPLAQQATEFITGSLLELCYGAIVLLVVRFAVE